LKQGGGEVLTAYVLNFVEQVVDAKIGRIDGRLRGGKQPEMIVHVGTITGRLLGLGRLSGGGRCAEQLDLIAIEIQPRLDFAPAVGDVGANALQLVAQPVEFGVAQTLARQFPVHAIQSVLPSGRGAVEIEAEFVVQALRDFRFIDLRLGRARRHWISGSGVCM
jgi:hypothetical protein